MLPRRCRTLGHYDAASWPAGHERIALDRMKTGKCRSLGDGGRKMRFDCLELNMCYEVEGSSRTQRIEGGLRHGGRQTGCDYMGRIVAIGLNLSYGVENKYGTRSIEGGPSPG
jgi:hypothetical protein